MQCNTCNYIKTILSIIFTAVMAAAILGAYYAHMTPYGLQFGTMKASLSILAVVITLMLWTRNLDCSSCPTPKYQRWVVLTILILCTIASLISVYKSHITPEGIFLGTQNASLSILAFVITATYWAKQVESVCRICTLPGSSAKKVDA